MINVVDIGALHVGAPPSYTRLREYNVLTIDPQDEKCGLQLVIGDGNTHTLYICAVNEMTSLLEPLPKQYFAEFEPFARIVNKHVVQTWALDDLDLPIDYLRMDVQGSELMILQNARLALHDTVAVELEVSFIPLYKKQPLFGDVDRELRLQGFLPHRFVEIKLWDGQLLEADVLYTKHRQLLDDEHQVMLTEILDNGR